MWTCLCSPGGQHNHIQIGNSFFDGISLNIRSDAIVAFFFLLFFKKNKKSDEEKGEEGGRSE
jgi:hypothetical protein